MKTLKKEKKKKKKPTGTPILGVFLFVVVVVGFVLFVCLFVVVVVFFLLSGLIYAEKA